MESIINPLPHFKQKYQLCLVSYKVLYRFLAYRISFIGYLFIKWVKGKQIIIQRKEYSWEISIQKR